MMNTTGARATAQRGQALPAGLRRANLRTALIAAAIAALFFAAIIVKYWLLG